MFDFTTSALVITDLNLNMIDDILNEFTSSGHIPITIINEKEKIFIELKEKVEKDGDVLHYIIYMIEYQQTFEA